jgi:hypothetical protein
MAWSTLYITILEKHSAEWLSSKAKLSVKLALVTKVSSEIQKYRTENHPEEQLLINLEKVGL